MQSCLCTVTPYEDFSTVEQHVCSAGACCTIGALMTENTLSGKVDDRLSTGKRSVTDSCEKKIEPSVQTVSKAVYLYRKPSPLMPNDEQCYIRYGRTKGIYGRKLLKMQQAAAAAHIGKTLSIVSMGNGVNAVGSKGACLITLSLILAACMPKW